MPHGPLGGPRPGSDTTFTIQMVFHHLTHLNLKPLQKRIERRIAYSVHIDIFYDEGNTFVLVTVESNVITFEEIRSIIEECSQDFGPSLITDSVSVSANVTGKVADAPRPIAKSSVNLMFNSIDENKSYVEERIEMTLRKEMWSELFVTVSEGMQFAGQTITVITGRPEVHLDDIAKIQNMIEKMTDQTFDDRTIEVKAT